MRNSRRTVAGLLLLGEIGEFGAEGSDLALDFSGGALGVLKGGFGLRAAGAGLADEGVLLVEAFTAFCKEGGDLRFFLSERAAFPLPASEGASSAPASSVS